jgi:hypothetical protein
VRDRFGVELRREVEYLQREVQLDALAGDE